MILSKPEHIKIYGHRGARGNLPENTLRSFKFLFDNNISAYETDILISKDLVPVIFHDFRLNPNITKTNDGEWIIDDIKIFDQTFEELTKFNIGAVNKRSKYGKRFLKQKKLSNQKIPKLSELLELTSKNLSDNLVINLEIKSTPVEKKLTPNPNEMVKLIMDDVNKFELNDKIILLFNSNLLTSSIINLTILSGLGVKFFSMGVDLISKFITKLSDKFFKVKSRSLDNLGIFC